MAKKGETEQSKIHNNLFIMTDQRDKACSISVKSYFFCLLLILILATLPIKQTEINERVKMMRINITPKFFHSFATL